MKTAKQWEKELEAKILASLKKKVTKLGDKLASELKSRKGLTIKKTELNSLSYNGTLYQLYIEGKGGYVRELSKSRLSISVGGRKISVGVECYSYWDGASVCYAKCSISRADQAALERFAQRLADDVDEAKR